MKKLMKRVILFLLSVITVFSFAACKTEKAVNTDGIKLSDWDDFVDYSESDKTIEYTWFLLDGDLYDKNSDVIKEIETKFNVKINVIGGGTEWKNALSNKINANEIPDLFFSLPDSGTYSNYIDTKVIMPLDGLIERADAKNLKALFATDDYKYGTKIAGMNFFAPMLMDGTEHALYVNKEWMKSWNESRGQNADAEPETLDEFTAMLKYFHDESSLGKGTTYGLSLSSNWDMVKSLMATFGSAIDWDMDSEGNFSLAALSEEYKALLEWMKAGVEYGYIYPEFDTDNDGESIQKLVKKTCGACITNGALKVEEVADEWDVTGNTPIDEVLVCITPPDNGENRGKFWGNNGYWGGVSIGITAKEPMRLIRILDYLYSHDGGMLMTYGVEGKDYALEDGKVVIDERHYKNRKDAGVYYTPKKRGDYGEMPIGQHKYNFVGFPFTIQNNKCVFEWNEANYWNKEFAKKVYEYTRDYKQNSNPTFLLNNMDWSDKNSKILDAAKRFSLQVVKGTKSYSSALGDLRKSLDSYNYNGLCEYFKTTYKETYGK